MYDIECGECHGESLFATDPASMTPEELRAAQNTMCLNCHTKTTGTYQGIVAPKIGAHDSATFYGASFTFVTSCLDCHHPHYQSQQLYWGRRTAGSPGQLGDGLCFFAHPIERISRQGTSYLQIVVEDGFHLPVEFLRARSMGSWLRVDHGRVQAERSD